MTENKFPKKELIVLAIGEAIFVLVTILSFLGVSVSGIIEFEFSYRVVTGALLGAVIVLLNFIFLSMSVNMAVDEYIALRGDKEMTEEEAEAFASKNSALIQNAMKRSFTVRVVSIGAALVLAFLLDWFNPLATIVPILAYQPILTWGNYIYDAVERIIARMNKEKAEARMDEPSEVSTEAAEEEITEDAKNASEVEINEDVKEASETEAIEDEVIPEPQEEILADSEDDGEESTEEEAHNENEENTEGSGI